MAADDWLGRISVVLVRARNPNNIGAVARAMHDFGLRDLRVVNEFTVPFEAARSAVDASAVLARARTFPSVAEAVADATLVVGTTAVGERDLQHELLLLADAAPRVRGELARSSGARVALLFGSEKTGLSNEELSFCHWLLTIPMYDHEGVRHPSMNLGQAVAVCLYELVRGSSRERVAVPEGHGLDGEPPAAAELDRLAVLLAEVLQATGYTRHHPANTGEAELRRLVRRMGADTKTAPVWMGIFRQVLWKTRQG
ncbi:MAG: RNA methyltransferase [Acidobacteriaceae bacterium]